MIIRVNAHVVKVTERKDLRRIDVVTSLSPDDTAARLRARGIGFVDGDAVYLDTLWLRALGSDPHWNSELDEMLSFAGCRGWFDGLYLKSRMSGSSSADPDGLGATSGARSTARTSAHALHLR
jgi:hypothetical protein